MIAQNVVVLLEVLEHFLERPLAMPRLETATDLDRIPMELQGLHPKNPVNLPPKQGVQIELPPRVRGTTPMFWDWEGPGLTPHTQALVDGLVDAVDSWPH